MADSIDDDDDYGAFVIDQQVRISLWFVVTFAMSGIMVNVLAFQLRGVMSCPETMRNMCVPYVCLMISLFSGLFQIFPWPLFSGAHACSGPDAISSIYDEIVHWKQNLFQVPSGSFGKAFVMELARLYQTYADCSSLESTAYCIKGILCSCCLNSPEA